MTTLLTTLDRCVSTGRSIRWSPLVAAPVAASAALLVAGPLASGDPASVGIVGECGLAFTAVSAAFIADDACRDAAPGTPVEAPKRLATRAGLMAPVAVIGWLVVLAVYASVTPSLPVDLGERILAGSGIAVAALALAAVGGRLRSVASPGAVGAGAVAALGLALQAAPARWLEHLPPATVVSAIAIAVGLMVVVLATREPAGS
jgi:hypothetical protein